jgi:hypothetical protein
MRDGSLIIWGIARRDLFTVTLADDGLTVTLTGTFCDSKAPVAVISDELTFEAGIRVDVGQVFADEPLRDWSHGGGLRRG